MIVDIVFDTEMNIDSYYNSLLLPEHKTRDKILLVKGYVNVTFFSPTLNRARIRVR